MILAKDQVINIHSTIENACLNHLQLRGSKFMPNGNLTIKGRKRLANCVVHEARRLMKEIARETADARKGR